MPKSPPSQPLLSQEELSALMASASESRVDRWFKYRNLFLLTVVIAQCIKLLFYPDLALGNFQHDAAGMEALARYMHYRALFVVLIAAFYLFSYLRNWYFERVSLVYVGIAFTALGMDYMNAYAYLSQSPVQWMSGLIALRILALICLTLNALNARSAPGMPRTLWS